MKATRLRKLYDGLSGHDRLRLMILAEARGDRREREYLRLRCPEIDAEDYEAALELARAMLVSFTVVVQRSLGRLQLIEALSQPLADLVAGIVEETVRTTLLAVGWDESPPAPTRRRLSEGDRGLLEAAWRGELGRLKAVLEAFDRACGERLGVGARELLAALAPEMLQTLEPLREALEESVPDERLAQAMFEAFAGRWERRAA